MGVRAQAGPSEPKKERKHESQYNTIIVVQYMHARTTEEGGAARARAGGSARDMPAARAGGHVRPVVPRVARYVLLAHATTAPAAYLSTVTPWYTVTAHPPGTRPAAKALA